MKPSMPLSTQYPWRREDVVAYFEAPREARAANLESRVVGAVRKAWQDNRFYQEVWSKHGLKPDDISRLSDLTKLPTTRIDDFRSSMEQQPPHGLHFSMSDMGEATMLLTTGGTTGSPRTMLVTDRDKRSVGLSAARVWNWIGVGPDDVVQVLAPFSTHGAAWVALWGLEYTQACVIPTGGGRTTSTVQQVRLMEQLRPTTLLALPNYLRLVAQAASEAGLDAREFGIKRILCGAEPLSPAMRREIERTWGAKVYDVYGTVDTLVWSSVDCEANRESHGALGAHLWTDLILPEILDDDGNPCRPGEYGDLTFTSWLAGAGPKFRYRTGDRTAIVTDQCPCGLDTPRMMPIHGRVDDRLRFNGVNLWPSSIDEALHRASPDTREYVVIARTSAGRDILSVQIEGDHEDDKTVKRVRDEFQASFGVRISPEIVPRGSTAPLTGQGETLKAKRVIDAREEA